MAFPPKRRDRNFMNIPCIISNEHDIENSEEVPSLIDNVRKWEELVDCQFSVVEKKKVKKMAGNNP